MITDELMNQTLNVIAQNWRNNDLFSLCNCKLPLNPEQFEELFSDKRFREKYSDCKLSKKFRKLLHPFFDKSEEEQKKEIYCKVEVDNSEPENGRYSLFAITKEMLEADTAYYETEMPGNINRNNLSMLDLLYKPYLYELVFKCSMNELISLVTRDENNCGFDLYPGVWCKVTIEPAGDDNGGDTRNAPRRVEGTLWYSASRPEYETVLISEISKVDQSFANTYQQLELYQNDIDNCIDSNRVKHDYLDLLFCNVRRSRIKVMRVGQANAIIVSNVCRITGNASKKRVFAFDLGLPTPGNVIENDKVATGIIDDADDKLMENTFGRPEALIISHWHSDHFNGIYVLHRDMFFGTNRMIVIAPRYIVNDDNYELTNRLIKFLINKGSIIFVDDVFEYGDRSNKCYYRLMRVNERNENYNENCLMLRINKTLLAGDCEYYAWPAKLFEDNSGNNVKKVNNIIIPHHAAYYNTQGILNCITPIMSSTPKLAIACVGHNTYGDGNPLRDHPVQSVLGAYDHENFDVLCTNNTNIASANFAFEA